MTLLAAILLVGLLVLVHELGHFALARLLDVKVLRLSIGFGPRLFSFRRNGTEYALSAIPLGGYVKMLGEDPDDPIAPADQGRAFPHKPLWKRVAIVLAGPAANLLFPVVIYFHFFVGQQSALSSTVGAVFEGQPAAGVLQPGDRIVAIDDEPVRYWEDVERMVAAAPERDLRITVERPGSGEAPITKVVTPRAHERRDLLGASERVGMIGVAPHFRLAQIGVQRLPSGESPAARAGLRTFDVVTAVQGRPVGSWRDLEAALGRNRGEPLVVAYLRADGDGAAWTPLARLTPGTAQVFPERVVEGGRAHYATGIRSGELFVREVEAGTPAAAIGLRAGDELTSLDGAPLRPGELLEPAFEERPERPFGVGWVDGDGKPHQATVKLSPRTRRDEYQTESTLYVFGAQPARAVRPVPEVPIEGRAWWAAGRSLRLTAQVTATMARILALLAAGRVPATAIGGPIMIYHLAGVAAARGADQYLAMVALISLNLGLINLLPVPILDGGQLLFLGIEAVRRRPIGRRTRDRAAWIGLALLAALMLLAAYNDLVRYWRYWFP